jgi:hypothetical protein
MFRRLRPIVAATLALSVTTSVVPIAALAAPKAGVSDEDRKKAIQLFKEGQAFQDAGKWEEALAKFEDVGKIVMTPGTRFNIGLCKENLGRLLEALDDYVAAERDAKAEKKAEIEKKAHDAAETVKVRIPKIVLKVPDVEGVTVTLDGKPIDPANPEMSVDPGKHKIEASAEKRVPFSTEVTVAEKETKDVAIRLPEQPKEEPAEPPPEPPKEEPKKKTPTVAYIVGATGVASLIAGGIFYGLRASKKSDLEGSALCDQGSKHCAPEMQDTIDAGKRYTTLGNVFMIVGVVGVGAGVVLWATAPKSVAGPKSVESTPEPKTDSKPNEDKPAEEKAGEPAASIRLVPYAPGANLGGIGLTATF